jgi:hypothetical protein
MAVRQGRASTVAVSCPRCGARQSIDRRLTGAVPCPCGAAFDAKRGALASPLRRIDGVSDRTPPGKSPSGDKG